MTRYAVQDAAISPASGPEGLAIGELLNSRYLRACGRIAEPVGSLEDNTDDQMRLFHIGLRTRAML